MNKTISDYVDLFINNLEIKQSKQESSIRMYRHYMKHFVELYGNKPLDSFDLLDCDEWNKHLYDKGVGKATISAYLICLRGFIRWLNRRGVTTRVQADQIELPRYTRTIKEVPDIEEVKKLIASVNPNKHNGLRDRAIIELLVSSGMRVAEIATIQRNNLDLKNNRARIVGKGSKERLVKFSDPAVFYLQKYLDQRDDDLPWVFVRAQHYKNRENLDPRSIERLLERYSKNAGIKSYSPHAYRHFFATHLLAKGADLYSVSRLLGHSSISTTQIYLHFSDKQLEETHEKVFKKSLTNFRFNKKS